jgi:multidrug efflux pump subunit AcrB
VTVLAKTEGRTVNEILADLEPQLKKMQTDWPAGYAYHFGGEAESAAETYSSAGKMFVVAIFLVFALLALQFGSFTRPFIIMLSIPFATIGTFGGFFLAWIPFSFPAMIGIISLVGIVVNDAIVIIETMNAYRSKGLSVEKSGNLAICGLSDDL